MTFLWATAVLLLLLLPPSISRNASADDIPHENYDLVGSNLDVVIALLNSSIGYSEYALMAMYNESMGYVEQNLSVVRGILTPAEQLLGKIQNVAGSYTNLSRLLPPFAELSSQEDSFATMEVSLIESRDELLSASLLANLTGQELLRALDSVNRVNSLLLQMNRTIDDMLVYAHEIIALTVDSRQPFAENQLIPLIEKLRDLLYTIELQVKRIVNGEGGIGGIQWSKTQPFLLLWLEKTSYYLGEEIRGGGYLFFNGTFALNHNVQITIDGVNLTSSLTDRAGRYSFEYGIPVNSSWLGTHSMQSTANTPNGTLHSSPVDIAISLIPTTVSLDPSGTLLSLREQLQAKAHVSTFLHGQPLTNAACHFVLDGANIAFRTDLSGSFTQTWQASNLGLGTHSLLAVYEGELPYAPSSSQTVEVVVNIPTSVTLNLFQTRYYLGYFVVGDGILLANGTEPLANEEITLSVDGIDVANITTDAKGDFAFSISTKNMTVGAHTLRAAFLHHESMWRYSQDEKGFTVTGLKKVPYPFWPFIPGWGGLSPPSTFPELFIGNFAYITWLLILVVLFIAIRILQVNKRRKEFPGVSVSEHLEPLTAETTPQSPLMPMSEDFALELARAQEAPSNPNARIVWYYHSLLSFLTRKRRVSLTSSMTHWEVARLLTALGFSFNQVEAATVLFERAFYSGSSLTESDAVRMSSALTDLVTTRQREVTNAV